MNVRVQSSVYRVGSDRVLGWMGTLAIGSYVLDGPVRYVLHILSAEMALYSRDGFALLAVGLAVLSWGAGQANAMPLPIAAAILLAHGMIGLLLLPSTFQALVGLKVFLSFLFGFVLAPLVRRYPSTLLRIAELALLVTALGVFLNLYVAYPWIGLNYQTALGSVEASKQWWQSGAQRLPGFARVSFNAASYVVLALVPLLATQSSFARRTCLIAIAGATILLTTTKGAWTSLLAVLVEFMLAYRLRLRTLANAFLIALFSICVALPVIAVQTSARTQGIPEWLVSFMQRVGDMWPRAFALWGDPGQVLWGRGPGGIGVAQQFGEILKFNAADNLMVYLLVTFGVLGVVYVAVYLVRLLHLSVGAADRDFAVRCARGWTALWLAYGFTTNMVEEPVMNMAIGVSFGIAFGTGRTNGGLSRAPQGSAKAEHSGRNPQVPPAGQGPSTEGILANSATTRT